MTDLAARPAGTDMIDDGVVGLSADAAPEPFTVVRATGLIDDRWVVEARQELMKAEPGIRVVLDLTDAILVSKAPVDAAIHQALRAVEDPSDVAVVCRRMSAMMLLRRWGVANRVPVFTSVDDAEQALADEL